MVQVLSKFASTNVSCIEYVHPWTNSCLEASCGVYLYSIMSSFKIYLTVYMLGLVLGGKVPSLKRLQKTFKSILQSTAFLSGTALGYSLFLCSLRRIFGGYNILTVSAIPAFLSSVFAIQIEKPHRRLLLSLYVSNVATETLWNMASARNWVKSIQYGEVAIFSLAMCILLMYFKGGHHKKLEAGGQPDRIFSILGFIVGPYEEKDYTTRSSNANTFIRQQVVPNDPTVGGGSSWRYQSKHRKNSIYHLVIQALYCYKKIVHAIKCSGRHHSCPHPFSCLYYTVQGTSKMFTVGLGIQLALRLVMNLKQLIMSPSSFKKVFFNKRTISLATALGGYCGLFRAVCCLMRHLTGKDSCYHAIPAGLIGGIAFSQYSDTTIALYIMWKMAQMTYSLGVERGILPDVPGFTAFLYCFSTAILFHAAILEPTNLRPSYWKFLYSLSGGRIASMNRKPLDVWGLGTSDSLANVIKKYGTKPIVKFYV